MSDQLPVPLSRWCPSCGDEYEPRIESCIDCDVPLVDREPTELHPVDRRAVGNAAEADVEVMAVERPIRFDIGHLISEHREQLIEHLEAVPIPFLVIDEDTLEAVPGYEEELGAAVTGSERESPFRRRRSIVPLVGRPLGVGRRVASVLIDGLVAGATLTTAAFLIDDRGLVALVLLAVLVLGHVVGVGERGRSVGKAMVGARLRSIRGGPLSAVEASVRWLVRDGPVLLSIGVGVAIDDPGGIILALQLFGFVSFIGIGVSVLLDQQFRGLHDELVDAAVVEASTRTPRDGGV